MKYTEHLEIKFLNLFWVQKNRFTKLFWLRDRKTGLFIARCHIEDFVEVPAPPLEFGSNKVK